MDINVAGRRVFAHTGGKEFDPSGQVLVLVHGAGNDHTVWGLQTRYFAHHGFSVLAFDLPGHGRSEGPPPDSIPGYAEWLWETLDVAGVERAALAGHSMGALISLAAAAGRPGATSALVLVGASKHMQVHPDLLAAAAADDPLAFELITDWGFGKPAHRGGHQAPGLWLRGGGRALLASSAPGVLANDLKACNVYDEAVAQAAKVNAPALLLLADADRMTPPRAAQPLAEALAQSQTVILPGAGHMIMVERPNETIDSMNRFLQKVAA